jgi:SOS-response transcriptional repressor LexA
MNYEVVVVRSFELDDRSAVVSAIARIAKYLVGKEKQRSLKDDTTWFDRAAAPAGQPTAAPQQAADQEARPFRIVQPKPKDCYRTCLPLLPLKAAAGFFSDSQAGVDGEVEWVEIDGSAKPAEGLFVAQVIGESMNRRIPNGAWCVWRANPTGTRNGSVVIAEHPDINDAALVGRYTVKVYESEKVADADGGWRHSRVTLKPDSTDPSFKPLVLENLNDGDLRIVAQLVEVLK